jgi:hypothetical protein
VVSLRRKTLVIPAVCAEVSLGFAENNPYNPCIICGEY